MCEFCLIFDIACGVFLDLRRNHEFLPDCLFVSCKVFISCFFSDPEPVQTTPSNNVGIIAGVLGALVLIVIVIIAVLLYKKYYILLLFAVNINSRKIINHIILYNTWRY